MKTKYKTYATGEQPCVGDKVKVSLKNDLNYYSTLKDSKSTHTVTKIIEGVKSTLVQLDTKRFGSPVNPMKASQFDRVTPSAIAQPKHAPGEFIIIDTSGSIVAVCESNETMTRKLEVLLSKDPTKEFRVYSYVATGKTERPTVVWEYERPNVQAVHTLGGQSAVASKEPVDKPKMFTKK